MGFYSFGSIALHGIETAITLCSISFIFLGMLQKMSFVLLMRFLGAFQFGGRIYEREAPLLLSPRRFLGAFQVGERV